MENLQARPHFLAHGSGTLLDERTWNEGTDHTRAKIELKQDRALLTQGKAQFEVRALSPKGAKFEIVSANPPPPQAQQPDVQNLVLRVPSATQVRIAVLLAPVGSEPLATVEPLSKWIALAKQKK